jgi:OOP family OmpA-OmpF porin
MRTILKLLLISSALLVTIQQSHAEQLPNFSGQAPIWNFGQAPIAWGDCVPVPVVPVPYGQNNISMGQMGMNQATIPQPMMQQFPTLMNGQPIILPPPSSFFGNAIPAPIPLASDIVPVVCDDSALQALQAKYDQGAAASRAKIAEITQALNDSNNQMTDARVIIDNLSKKSKQDDSKLSSELSMLEMQLTNSRNANKSLQEKLLTAESSSSDQAHKFNALNLSVTELTALKGAYKECSDENSVLKKQLTSLNNDNKSLQTKLSTAESKVGNQARKITVLNQSAVELVALQSAYKTRNDKNAELKMQLAQLANNNKSLQTQLNTASTNAGNQAKKLTALSQAGPELAALKSAYKERNDENEKLKKMLAEMDGAYKTLQTQLSTAKTDAGSQARKLTALSQTSAELTALKSAYKDRNDENTKLKKMLADLDGAHKALQAQLSLATKDASAQARKLVVLGQSATELTAIQSAYKEKVNQNIALKSQLAELSALKKFSESCRAEVSDLDMKLTNTDNKRKSLLGKIATLETTSSGQARKITSLMLATGELDALKSAYKDLSSKKIELTSKLTKATADTDNDGVLDSLDKCPYSLAGAEVNASGCLADADNDGIVNSKDECPASPINTHVNKKGCPKISDADSDGVADTSDLCPATVAGAKVNQFGCEPTESITLKGVTFDTGSARLTASSIPIVTAAAVTLNKNPDLNIEISGYTDNQGLGYINKRLSQRRANTVMIQLIKDGVDANRLKAKGYGEKNPVASNKTIEGRATNRRVELKISQ